MNNKPTIELLGEKRYNAHNLRQQGFTFKEIGLRLGVTGAYAQRLYWSSVRKLQKHPDKIESLSTRAFNCLYSVGINTREKALEAFQSKQIQPFVRPRNYGWKTHEEIAAWLGLPKPIKPKPRVVVRNECPHCGKRIKP